MLIQRPFLRVENLLLLGVLSFIPTLFFYLVGEEGIYTITSMEMWHRQTWVQQFTYGADNGRPPLFNWLIVPVARLLGWQHVVEAARLVTVGASLGMVAVLYWLCRRLLADKAFALFAALACMTLADLFLYRGWLTYTDPVFSFFTFAAIATLWVAAEEKRHDWLCLSVLLLSAAMLTKAFTTYVFYGSAAFVFLFDREKRRFLFSTLSLVIFAAALAIPLLWFLSIPRGNHAGSMISEIVSKLSARGWLLYGRKLLSYPLETLVQLAPALPLALYLKWRSNEMAEASPLLREGIWIALLGFLPYWLAPQGSIRYLMPIYPVAGLVAACLIWQRGDKSRQLALRWFAAMLVLKFLFVLVFFPLYQKHYRGENYARAAGAIVQRVGNSPMYVTDSRSIGLNLASYINSSRFPAVAPLTFPPKDFSSGYILVMEPDPKLGQLVETYKLAAEKIYLLCRGSACDAAAASK